MGLPKILVGGVLIIDLMSLSLTPSVDMETYTPISNSEVLSQLLRLKQYIETPTAQKPLWVRMSYDGETITTMGALYKEDGDPHFKLVVKILDRRLIIDVVFTQDEETLEWYIDTEDAKYLFTSNEQQVVADITDKDIQINGLTSKGIANTGGLANIGNVAITGDLDVISGTIKGNLRMSDIKDSAGNSRFIEGDTTGYSSKLNISYAKWSLSGTHLMIVVAGVLPAGESLTAYTDRLFSMSSPQIPQWILNKIYPTVGIDVISNMDIDIYKNYNTKDTFNGILTINVNDSVTTAIYLNMGDNVSSYESDRYFRVCVDLLIDSDYE